MFTDSEGEDYGDFDEWEDSDGDIMSEQEYMAEVTAHERVGGGIFQKLSKTEKIVMNPLEKFRYNLKNTVLNLNKNYYRKLFDESISLYMEEMATNLENIERKNVLAYILGFYTIDKKRINRLRFNEVVNKILPIMDNDDVTAPDIIRYGRLWESLLK